MLVTVDAESAADSAAESAAAELARISFYPKAAGRGASHVWLFMGMDTKDSSFCRYTQTVLKVSYFIKKRGWHLKVSYFIKKRGWHENRNDGTRHTCFVLVESFVPPGSPPSRPPPPLLFFLLVSRSTFSPVLILSRSVSCLSLVIVYCPRSCSQPILHPSRPKNDWPLRGRKSDSYAQKYFYGAPKNYRVHHTPLSLFIDSRKKEMAIGACKSDFSASSFCRYKQTVLYL